MTIDKIRGLLADAIESAPTDPERAIRAASVSKSEVYRIHSDTSDTPRPWVSDECPRTNEFGLTSGIADLINLAISALRGGYGLCPPSPRVFAAYCEDARDLLLRIKRPE